MSLSSSPTPQPRPVPSTSRLRQRLVWTAVLVLIALGGAGLAAAADRAPTDVARPELTWRAEQAIRPWIESLAGPLVALDEEASRLSAAGRGVLVGLATQDPAALEAALAEGAESRDRLSGLVADLADRRTRQREAIPDGSLGDGSRLILARIDTALAAGAELPEMWTGLVDAAGDADAPSVADRLGDIEQARGSINDTVVLLP